MSNKITFFEVVVGYLNYSKIFEFCKHTILLSSGGMLNLYFSSEKEERVQLLFFNENRDFFFKIRIQTNGMVCNAWNRMRANKNLYHVYIVTCCYNV